MNAKGPISSEMKDSEKKADENVAVLPTKLERGALRLAPQRCDPHV